MITKGVIMLDQTIGTEFHLGLDEFSRPSQRLHLILLGVADVARSAEFYEKLGWQRSLTGHETFVKFDLGGYALCLLPKTALAADALSPSAEATGFAGTCFVYLARTPEEVPGVLNAVALAGGEVVKPATRTHWGIAGYFRDLDGHLFEVDYEDPWVLDKDHRLVVDELK